MQVPVFCRKSLEVWAQLSSHNQWQFMYSLRTSSISPSDLEICSHVMWTWSVTVRENTSDLTQSWRNLHHPQNPTFASFSWDGEVRLANRLCDGEGPACFRELAWMALIAPHVILAYLIADSQLICFDFWMFPTTCTFQLEAFGAGGFARRVASNEEAGEEAWSGGYVL